MAGLSFEDLLDAIVERHVNRLYDKLSARLDALEQKEQNRLITSQEARKLFVPELSLSTLKLWTKEGKLKSYRIGGRVFYKQIEILEATKTLKKYQY